MLDVHLSANRLSPDTAVGFVQLGFTEDHFQACRNCAPTQFHATMKVPEDKVEKIWQSATSILSDDGEFDGALEQESTVAASSIVRESTGLKVLSPLPKYPCPSTVYKACDVHIRIRAQDRMGASRSWLEELDIASFERRSSDGRWKIYTATFDTLEAGYNFFEFIKLNAPRCPVDGFRVKLERVEQVYRKPASAATLPLTRWDDLRLWLCSMGETWHKEAFFSAAQARLGTPELRWRPSLP